MRVRRLPADVVAALVGAAALMLAGPASAQAVAPLTGGEPAVPPEVEQTEPAPEAAAAREPPPAPAPETPEPAAPVPAEPAFPGSGSQAGSPLQAYGERGRAGGEAPERARGWKVEPGAEGEDYVLFPPRALLFLPKLALELVFTPLEVLLAGIDRNKLVPRVIDLFYFDQAHTTGFYPTASSESGYGFSYGAKVFHNDVLGHEESASIKGTFGGRYVQAYELAFEGDRVGGSRLWLESRARYEVQPARLFFGLGNREIQATPGDLGPRDASIATRFRQERALGMLRIGGTIGGLGDLTKVGVSAIYNHRVFGPEERSFAEPSIETVYDTRQITGFRGGADTFELDLNLIRDTRDTQGLASSGTYLELLAGGVPPIKGYQFFHYGGELRQYFDLYAKTRVLVVRAALEGVSGGEDEIPFAELPRLGGVHDLRGYLSDRFRDKLAAVATAEYRYPIHELLSGKLFVDAGDVGRTYDDLFGPGPFERWEVGAGGGFLLHSKDSILLSVDVAYGDQLTVFFTTAPLEFFHNRSQQL